MKALVSYKLHSFLNKCRVVVSLCLDSFRYINARVNTILGFADRPIYLLDNKLSYPIRC